MAQGSMTTVCIDRASVSELRSIATDLAREERRRVTLGEVVRRLIEVWRAGGGV
jgi:hypothetical protein